MTGWTLNWTLGSVQQKLWTLNRTLSSVQVVQVRASVQTRTLASLEWWGMYFPIQVSLRTQSYRDGQSDFPSLINLFIFMSSTTLTVLGMSQISIQAGRQEYLPSTWSQRCHLRGPQFMSSWGDSTAIHQLFVAVDVSLSHGTDWRCFTMGSTEADHSVSRTAMMHLDAVLNWFWSISCTYLYTILFFLSPKFGIF